MKLLRVLVPSAACVCAAAGFGCQGAATEFDPVVGMGPTIAHEGSKPNVPVQMPDPDAGTTAHDDAGTQTEADAGTPAPDAGTAPQGCTAYEPNNSLSAAVELTAGTYAALELCASDIDIFKIQVPAQHVLSATLDFTHAAGDLDLYFSDGTLDADGYINTFASSRSRSADDEEIINEGFAAPTTVWVLVHGYQGAMGKYDLQLRINPGVADRDCFAGCSDLIQLPGSFTWGSAQSVSDGYYLATYAKYAWGRRDLLGLVRYAIRETHKRFPATASDAIGIGDICQADGKTPGVDVGSPRHPTTTHVRGKDIDIAYFQNDGKSNYQIICGDGSDNNGNGQTGQYNDGYFCTTSQNVVDVPRHVYFMAKLAESPLYRVIGVDQTLVPAFRAEALKLYQNKEISLRQYRRVAEGLGYGSAGGWQFHHHHLHLSLYE